MSDFKSLFAEGTERGIAKIAWMVGLILILIGGTLAIQPVVANKTYIKKNALITEWSLSETDTTFQTMTYEYRMGNEVVKNSETWPVVKDKHFAVGDTLRLLLEPETYEIMYEANAGFQQYIGLKFGVVGILLLIAAQMFLNRNPPVRK